MVVQPRRPFSKHLCLVGPMGRHAGWVVTQGEILSKLFQAEGYSVISVSSKLNRYRRLLDITLTLIRRRKDIEAQCLSVFGGLSFVIEDIASWLGRRFGHRIIMVLRGGAMPEFIARHPRWARRVLDRADALVAPSEFLARAVEQLGYQCHVIPNVIDISSYPYRHRRRLAPRLLWMRTFHPVYNPLMAVRVLGRLRATVPEATLVMAGQEKGMQGEVEQLVDKLGLRQAVRFAGFLDMPGKARESNAADIFLNTNHVDNMPVSVVEACAMGLPVVASAVGGIPDLLTDGETALLVRDDDDEAMVAAIRRLLDDPDLAGRLSANGRQLAEASAWPKVRLEWERLFAAVMAEVDARKTRRALGA